ncbi:50S ribosomal protein L11 methyltransferase [Elusimicrobiota bacterium]
MKTTVFEVSQRIAGTNRENVRRVLSSFKKAGVKEKDIASIEIDDAKIFAYYTESLKTAKSIKQKFLKNKLPEATLAIKKLNKSDWLTRWEKESRPFYIKKHFRIVPQNIRSKFKATKKDIYIDATRAFGLGEHPTTMFMAEFVIEKAKKCRSLLDVGTGSGILSIVANKCGIKDVWATDISPDALETADSNFIRNKTQADLFYGGDFRKAELRRKFDFICANLFSNVLIGMKKKFLNHLSDNGYLAVSGIWKDEIERFKERFNSKRLKIEKVAAKKGWYAILYKLK